MPAEPSPPAKSVTAKTRRSPSITVDSVCSKTGCDRCCLSIASRACVPRNSLPSRTAASGVGRLDGRGIGAVDPFQPAVRGRASRTACPARRSGRAWLSWSAASRWFSSFSRACTRCALRQRQEAHDDMGGALAALHFQRRAVLRLDRRGRRRSPFSRSAATACSSAAAERGISQRPKARKAARSSGAPLSAGSVPISSGFLLVVVPDDDALVAQIEQRLGALERGVEVGDAAAQLDDSRPRCGPARGSGRSPRAGPRP